MGIHVFHSLEHTGTLPFPTIEIWFKIPAMAGPQGNDVAVQRLFVMTVGVKLADKRSMRSTIGAVVGCEILFYVISRNLKNNVIILIRRSQSKPDVFLQLID